MEHLGGDFLALARVGEEGSPVSRCAASTCQSEGAACCGKTVTLRPTDQEIIVCYSQF